MVGLSLSVCSSPGVETEHACGDMVERRGREAACTHCFRVMTLNPGPPSYLGVDLSADSISCVALKNLLFSVPCVPRLYKGITASMRLL